MKIKYSHTLLISYALITVISFGVMAFFLDRHLGQYSRDEIKQSLVMRAGLIQPQIPPDAILKHDLPRLETITMALCKKAGCRITVIDIQGRVLADSEKTREEARLMENHRNRPEVRSAIAGSIGVDTRYSQTLHKQMLYVATPVIDAGRVVGVARLALPVTNIERVIATIRATVFTGFFCALIFALLIGVIVARHTIQPVNAMIATARRFAQGDLSRRLVGYPKNEIGELAEALNKMAQDIEDMLNETSAQNQKLAAIFNSMIEGVIVVEKHGHIHSVNHAIERIFGITQEEAKGRIFLEAIRNNDIGDVITDVLKTGVIRSGEIDLVMPVRRTFQINAAPVFHHNAVIGCLVVIHDITDIRRLETMRRDFVANVSHELKTPLTSIKGFVETLLEGAIDDKANNRSFLKIIEEHADRLNNLVNDLLALSHLESKDIILRTQQADIRQLSDRIIQGFLSQAKKQGITVSNDIPVGASARADRERIGQVLTNLIDNAIKFNRKGGNVTLTAQELGEAVKITVADTGPGIPAKDISRIFERFYRVDKSRSRDLGGTGLGLSIVKHIVELHGGTVGVESTEGLGSRFWFTLPTR